MNTMIQFMVLDVYGIFHEVVWRKEEYDKSDGENFEAIIEQAAEILGVEIY